jgi:glutamate/tyrosine decarboxylase-like PLP-dependent enzyme
MAKVIVETIVLKLSKLVKDDTNQRISPEDLEETLEQVTQELVGDAVIVEVERAQ